MSFAGTLLGASQDDLAALLPEAWRTEVPAASHAALAPGRHGRLQEWSAALDALPTLTATDHDLTADAVRIGREEDASAGDREALHAALEALHPWRKGPFELFGVDIDTEWRSERKFARLDRVPFEGAKVLDVGCGNGYYALRMLGAGAASVIGADPGLGHLAQFAAVRRYAPELPARLLPLPFEALPATRAFDVVCSMGVLYHRRSPIDHLDALARMLTPGGTLVVESIVVAGSVDAVLCPPDRYARMRNVWFLPSTALLVRWLERIGLSDVEILHEGPTTTDEQRPTSWMRFESLAHALDPEDPARTVEGHPAPLRAVVCARRGR